MQILLPLNVSSPASVNSFPVLVPYLFASTLKGCGETVGQFGIYYHPPVGVGGGLGSPQDFLNLRCRCGVNYVVANVFGKLVLSMRVIRRRQQNQGDGNYLRLIARFLGRNTGNYSRMSIVGWVLLGVYPRLRLVTAGTYSLDLTPGRFCPYSVKGKNFEKLELCKSGYN